jgi:hypothetical protein
LAQSPQQLFCSFSFIVFVVADQLAFDAIVIEQLARVPRVLAGDQIGLTQDADGAVGNVFKVANGRGYNVQHTSFGLSGIRHVLASTAALKA